MSRRLALAAAAAAVTILVAPGVASAHTPIVECVGNGLWSIGNSEPISMTYSTSAGHSGTVGPHPSTITVAVFYDGTSLTVHGTWPNGVTASATGEGDCFTTTTTEVSTPSTTASTSTPTAPSSSTTPTVVSPSTSVATTVVPPSSNSVPPSTLNSATTIDPTRRQTPRRRPRPMRRTGDQRSRPPEAIHQVIGGFRVHWYDRPIEGWDAMLEPDVECFCEGGSCYCCDGASVTRDQVEALRRLGVEVLEP